MKIRFTLLLAVLFSSTHIWASMESDTSKFQFLVSLDQDTPQDSIIAYLEDLNAEEVWELDDVDIALWEVSHFPFTASDGEVIYDIQGIIRRSRLRTKIRSAEFNFETTLPDDDEAASNSSCFDPSVFQIETGTEEVKISILDTGISDISDNSTAEYNYNLTSYTGYDYVNDDDVPNDDHGHGSHIAGIIHSIVKHNPANNIVFDIRKTHDFEGKAMMSDIVLAMYEAIEEDADVINLSFGAQQEFSVDDFYPLRALIEEAEDEGVLVVVAAGNNGTDNDNFDNTMLPASFPEKNIVAVAAGDCNLQKAPFSNYGATTVDVITYGINVPGPDLGSGISYVSGTSQSTAIVSAVSALIATNDVDDYEEIKCQITNVGVPINGLNGNIAPCVEDRTVEAEENVALVYPTIISQGTVYVQAKEGEGIEVYNSIGEKVYHKNNTSNETVQIDAKNWSAGVYYVRVNKEELIKVLMP